jgi:molybdenum cofactor biosynthesis protein B
MGYHEHKDLALKNVACAVITTSDSRTEKEDESGALIRQRLADAGHVVRYYAILRNDADLIRQHINDLLLRQDIQAIITGGGTGLSHRDVTVDTITPLLEKKLEGFGELFRQLTYAEIGAGSILSRAAAGVARGKVVICLPGSLNAARLAMEKIIVPELGHMVREATR